MVDLFTDWDGVITYALNQWDALTVYTTDGDLNIDNNPAENAVRRIALGRKNWLFVGSDRGGCTAAVLFSLIATCRRAVRVPPRRPDPHRRPPAESLAPLDLTAPSRPPSNPHATHLVFRTCTSAYAYEG